MKKIIKKILNNLTHLMGKINRKYYFEDYVRVYPAGLTFNYFGKKRSLTKDDLNNFLNHCKFYRFSAQFVSKKRLRMLVVAVAMAVKF